MQNEGVVHDVLTSSPVVSPLERLIVWADHVEPFHCATTGATPLASPTAWQEVSLVQDTPSRSVASPRLVVATVQIDPFHCSMRTAPHRPHDPPTQNEVVTHEMPTSVVDVAPVTVGSVMGDHVVPVRSSA